MSDDARKIIAQNKKARHDYFVTEAMEVGIVLVGSEVKSLRAGRCSIKESFADVSGGEIFLLNANINEYAGANQFNHEPTRRRKLLLHKKQMQKLIGAIKRKGITLVPLSIYFKRGLVKVEMGIVEGKKKEDKRQSIKDREWKREQARLLKGKNK